MSEPITEQSQNSPLPPFPLNQIPPELAAALTRVMLQLKLAVDQLNELRDSEPAAEVGTDREEAAMVAQEAERLVSAAEGTLKTFLSGGWREQEAEQ